ncbi:uncharacterized protein LOC111705670 isoform X2 [Eurytemora carolleeae]|uniref:uncharacterized protein LOC111705670 isoform X2 n=1 Tax=Eurytemora carolleeae TaxID=1294199 RepID=UPI000C780A77|nr:uncharacterized protein LOC111705670 isoform X2 [Eurytemora carolleeae]|eukprot:XP_023334064.1 uncharacterized protein LOC111705670 isoform X2 [Eurytemora affinis]
MFLNFSLCCFLLAQLSHQTTAAECAGSKYVKKWTLWASPGTGLAATITVPVTQDEDGWVVELNFNKNFTKLQFFNGLTEVSEGSVFQVSNESWSGRKKAGDTIAFSLLGDCKNDNAETPIALTSILFNGVDLCTTS